MDHFTVREAFIQDRANIYCLYQRVSQQVGGLARTYAEITPDYIEHFSAQAEKTGIQLLIENSQDQAIVGEIHCYKLVPKVFCHILSELTIAVDPLFQGKGLGKMLFQALLGKVQKERKDILRVELIARESNTKAIAFYQKLGFQIEGRLVNRILFANNHLEADIPMAWMNEYYWQNDTIGKK